MQYRILTIFPELFEGFLRASLIGKAIASHTISISLTNIRDFADPPHFKVDDTPYGGGAGMVMKPEPLARAIENAKEELRGARVVLLSPSGSPFGQSEAHRLASAESLILVCGRYEGIDQRVIDLLVDEEICVGDAVVMGGEVPAMMVIEATARLLPEVIGNSASLACESFALDPDGEMLLEAPHYTRPEEFRTLRVPEVLRSGDHRAVAEWRARAARERTARYRPALLSPSGEER